MNNNWLANQVSNARKNLDSLPPWLKKAARFDGGIMAKEIRTGTFLDSPVVEIEGQCYSVCNEVLDLIHMISIERDELREDNERLRAEE